MVWGNGKKAVAILVKIKDCCLLPMCVVWETELLQHEDEDDQTTLLFKFYHSWKVSCGALITLT